MLARLIFCCVLWALASVPTFGQFTYSSPKRSITAQGPGNGTVQTLSANNGLPFNQTVSSSNNGGTASASQNSSFNELVINAAGTADPGSGIFGSQGNANSSFFISFRCPVNQTFVFAGNFSRATGQLVGNGVAISLNGTAGSINTGGTFVAGALYTLTLATSGGQQPGQVFVGNFNFALTLTGSVPVAQSYAFTYQGVLKTLAGQLITGNADLEFRLFPASAGAFQVGPTLVKNEVGVLNGVFGTLLDFGDVFDGSERWLEIAVRSPAGSGDFATLPRVRIQSTPYADYALHSGSVAWTAVTDVPQNVSEAFSPWEVASSGGIEYGAIVNVGNGGPREGMLNVYGPLQLSSLSGALIFGGIAENNDQIYIKRENINVGVSELRVSVGTNAPTDFFTVGTNSGGVFNPVFGFRMDGVASKPGGGSWANLSDPRAKHDITPMTGTLDRLLALRGYEYFYNDDAIKAGKALPGRHMGLMADEVQRVFPSWIDRDRDGMLIVTERSTTALMVEALRDLRAEKDRQIEELKRRVEEEEKRNAGLEERLKVLEERVR